jgi:hypothetical protein
VVYRSLLTAPGLSFDLTSFRTVAGLAEAKTQLFPDVVSYQAVKRLDSVRDRSNPFLRERGEHKAVGHIDTELVAATPA